jgi:hypothetical protein
MRMYDVLNKPLRSRARQLWQVGIPLGEAGEKLDALLSTGDNQPPPDGAIAHSNRYCCQQLWPSARAGSRIVVQSVSH